MRISEVFRYGRPYSAEYKEKDGLQNFFYITHTIGCALPLLEKGINPIASVKAIDGNRTPAILISSSPHKIGSHSTPWQDFFDPDNGHIKYFGDNKTLGRSPESAEGNSVLLRAQIAHNSPDQLLRELSIPVIFFKRIRLNGRAKGNVQFQGFGVIERVERIIQLISSGESFVNYSFDFTIFHLLKEAEEFNWEWISMRRNPAFSLSETLKLAPSSWKTWIKEGQKSREKCRRRVSKLYVTKAEHQRPLPGSKEQKVLEQIYAFYDNRKSRFELLAAKVASRIMASNGGFYREGWITPSSGDGGTDFVARLDIGSAFSKTKLVVLGQAKCQDPSMPTSGTHIARTVARLRRGWVGVFVTTSYFSEPVQREVIEDEYPIMLIHGLRLAEEVNTLIYEQGYKDVNSLLNELDSEYDSYVLSRRPEEIHLDM